VPRGHPNHDSDLHRRYLAAGGYGFIIGDGALAYALEVLGEVHCRFSLTRELAVGVNYQPVVNPAFNGDVGPIHVGAAAARSRLGEARPE
jgi:high affinity Mn2+ porin